jgi:hypothetical protein
MHTGEAFKVPAGEAREQFARESFPVEVPVEEYAARHGHRWMIFSFDDYRYTDSKLDSWVQRLGDILRGGAGTPSLHELRLKLLTAEERAAIEAEIAREDDEDL